VCGAISYRTSHSTGTRICHVIDDSIEYTASEESFHPLSFLFLFASSVQAPSAFAPPWSSSCFSSLFSSSLFSFFFSSTCSRRKSKFKKKRHKSPEFSRDLVRQDRRTSHLGRPEPAAGPTKPPKYWFSQVWS